MLFNAVLRRIKHCPAIATDIHRLLIFFLFLAKFHWAIISIQAADNRLGRDATARKLTGIEQQDTFDGSAERQI